VIAAPYVFEMSISEYYYYLTAFMALVAIFCRKSSLNFRS